LGRKREGDTMEGSKSRKAGSGLSGYLRIAAVSSAAAIVASCSSPGNAVNSVPVQDQAGLLSVGDPYSKAIAPIPISVAGRQDDSAQVKVVQKIALAPNNARVIPLVRPDGSSVDHYPYISAKDVDGSDITLVPMSMMIVDGKSGEAVMVYVVTTGNYQDRSAEGQKRYPVQAAYAMNVTQEGLQYADLLDLPPATCTDSSGKVFKLTPGKMTTDKGQVINSYYVQDQISKP
jgi:hypothetical protein